MAEGGRGGKREGAGRPLGALGAATRSKQEARDAFRRVLDGHMEDLIEAQLAHAKGIKYLVARSKAGGKFERVSTEQLEAMLAGQDDGTILLELWDKDPSVQAFTDLMNRYLDKPVEPVEVSGKDGGPLIVQWKG